MIKRARHKSDEQKYKDKLYQHTIQYALITQQKKDRLSDLFYIIGPKSSNLLQVAW